MTIFLWILLASVAFFVVSVLAYGASRLLGGKSKDRGDIPEPPKGNK